MRISDWSSDVCSSDLFPQARLFQVNVQPLDAHKHGAAAVVGDALLVLEALREGLGEWRVDDEAVQRDAAAIAAWHGGGDAAIAASADDVLPGGAPVLGAVADDVAESGSAS